MDTRTEQALHYLLGLDRDNPILVGEPNYRYPLRYNEELVRENTTILLAYIRKLESKVTLP